MKHKRVLPVILGSVGLLMLLWLLFACVAPPVTEEVAQSNSREVMTETCKTFTSTDVPKAIPDKGSEIPLNSFTTSKLSAPMPGYITALTVTFTIDHQKPVQLAVVLCGPRNLNCQLVTEDLTSTGGTYTVSFSSSPTTAYFDDIYYAPPYTGSYPANPYYEPIGLPKFINAAAAGEWRLAVRDNYVTNTGSLTAWSLELCTVPLKNTPTTTPTPFGPVPTYTPLWGCENNTYYARLIPGGGSNHCHCNDAAFEELLLEDEGDAGVDIDGVLCFNNCWDAQAEVNADFRVTYYDHPFNLGAGGQALVIAPDATPPPNNTSGFGGTGCVKWDHRGFLESGIIRRSVSTGSGLKTLSFKASAASDGPCPGPIVFWQYGIEFSECHAPTRTPSPTPKPTMTRPCPTPARASADWWSW